MHAMLTMVASVALAASPLVSSAKDIVHDAEYYVLKAQHGEKWQTQNEALDQKLAKLEKKFGRPPNIIHVM